MMRQVGVLATVGLAIGLAGAIAVTPLVGSLLLNLSPHDPASFAAVSIVLAVAGDFTLQRVIFFLGRGRVHLQEVFVDLLRFGLERHVLFMNLNFQPLDGLLGLVQRLFELLDLSPLALKDYGTALELRFEFFGVTSKAMDFF